ncbi:hypothetical protein JCM19294_1794 [Nonlabens tegetincola]|uniref:Uncharacterized protein n=1 Tax=Nonlabens tegetincola TaxID=323273 RepID=A0A090QL78_9FLAO|nr:MULTISPECIES: DUF1573 domain-containing protein [Nonlabens]MEE2800903.1 DUF1573 domain-containing protein [Bacteroidota bacterium]ALM21549.1 hypothetical protein AAT17_10055 [Nonlabens sp. MIC269]ARN71727.1 hypothetical protein BST91_08760 [Nonlabens tegetincola]PQJ14232.1 hypothetical protein BST93_13395 [Nonlabens tegetincola]GAK96281.1 hypothetical protein JCM19294_1794 [Nonlabens tegetincola]
MKKVIMMFAAVAAVALTSCNNESKAKIDEANLTAAAASKEVAADYPVMTFNEVEYDFGTVEEGTVVEHEYTFKNTGTAPLVVISAKGSCGCTVPTWSKEPIAPGEEGSMLVKFNTNGKPNNQTKTVTIKANTESGTESIRIKGFVNPKAKASPNA